MKPFINDEGWSKLVENTMAPMPARKSKVETKEQIHQAKIIKYLEKYGFLVIKLMVASKSGLPDILAINKEGQVWAIEVKNYGGIVSQLQLVKLREFQKNNCVVMVAWGYDDFVKKREWILHDYNPEGAPFTNQSVIKDSPLL